MVVLWKLMACRSLRSAAPSGASCPSPPAFATALDRTWWAPFRCCECQHPLCFLQGKHDLMQSMPMTSIVVCHGSRLMLHGGQACVFWRPHPLPVAFSARLWRPKQSNKAFSKLRCCSVASHANMFQGNHRSWQFRSTSCGLRLFSQA